MLNVAYLLTCACNVFSCLGCTLPLLLQHHGYPPVVSNPLHAGAHQISQRPGEQNCQIPLVCSSLPLPVLLSVSPGRVWTVHSRLAGPGRRRRAHRGPRRIRDRHQRDAVAMPPLLTQGPPQLGLPAPAPALHGAVGQSGDDLHVLLWQTLLLLLQVQQLLPKGRRGGEDLQGQQEEPGDIRQPRHVQRRRKDGLRERDAVLISMGEVGFPVGGCNT